MLLLSCCSCLSAYVCFWVDLRVVSVLNCVCLLLCCLFLLCFYCRLSRHSASPVIVMPYISVFPSCSWRPPCPVCFYVSLIKMIRSPSSSDNDPFMRIRCAGNIYDMQGRIENHCLTSSLLLWAWFSSLRLTLGWQHHTWPGTADNQPTGWFWRVYLNVW